MVPDYQSKLIWESRSEREMDWGLEESKESGRKAILNNTKSMPNLSETNETLELQALDQANDMACENWKNVELGLWGITTRRCLL